MKVKYILINGNKRTAKQAFINGDFIVWTDESVKRAFSFGNGTMEDFIRFSVDNVSYSTNIDLETLTYIDTGKPCNIDRKTINQIFSKYNVNQ